MKFLPYEDVPLFIGVDSGSGSSSGPSGKTFELLVNGTTYEFSESGANHNDKPVYTDSGNNYYIAFYDQMYLAYTGGNYAGWYVFDHSRSPWLKSNPQILYSELRHIVMWGNL